MHIKPLINLFEYGLTGGISLKILYILLFILLYQYLWVFKNNEIRSILKMEKFGIFWWRGKNSIKSGSVKVNGAIETRRGRKLNKGDKVIFLKNELIFE